MAKTVLFEEFHVTVRVPRGLSGPEYTAIRRSLNAACFHAALRRATREVVLHAIAGEHLIVAIVHHHRYVERDLPIRPSQDLINVRIQIEFGSGFIEALQAVLENIDQLGVREVICLGDVVGYGPQPCGIVACLP